MDALGQSDFGSEMRRLYPAEFVRRDVIAVGNGKIDGTCGPEVMRTLDSLRKTGHLTGVAKVLPLSPRDAGRSESLRLQPRLALDLITELDELNPLLMCRTKIDLRVLRGLVTRQNVPDLMADFALNTVGLDFIIDYAQYAALPPEDFLEAILEKARLKGLARGSK